jgi:hypothetical protein
MWPPGVAGKGAWVKQCVPKSPRVTPLCTEEERTWRQLEEISRGQNSSTAFLGLLWQVT